jgi:PKD repeat protein
MKNTLIKLFAISLFVLSLTRCSNDNSVIDPPVQNRVSIAAVSPNNFAQGTQSAIATISGNGFQQGATVNFGSGITVNDVNVANPQQIEVKVTVLKSAQPGPRTVSVNSSGGSATLNAGVSVNDNKAPVAKFTYTPNQGTIASTFAFDASTSTDPDGTIQSYKWEISDGTKPQGKIIHKQFKDIGDYTIQLTVTDNKGGTSSIQKEITVGDNLPPDASFSVDPTKGTQYTIFTFDATSSTDPDGSLSGYQWDFGDGKKGTGARVTHKYDTEGSYEVTLTVKDSNGATTTTSKEVDVVLFDKEQAEKDIVGAIRDFFNLFDQLETLSANEIVRDWSNDPGCSGKQHEIDAVETAQSRVIDANSDFLVGPVVTSVNDKTGHAYSTNRFFGTNNDGTHYDGVYTHNFSMVNDNGVWRICNFAVAQ